MPSHREAVTMPGGSLRYMSMNRPDLLSVARIQKQAETPQVLAQDGASTGEGLPVDKLTQMISQLKVKTTKTTKPRNTVSGQGVSPRGRRVAYI